MGAVCAVALAAGLAVRVANSRSPELMRGLDPVRVVEPSKVFSAVRSQSKPGDALVFDPWATPVIQYYLKRYGLRTAAHQGYLVLCAPPGAREGCASRKAQRRAFVIVSNGAEVPGRLMDAGLTTEFTARPVLVGSYRLSQLYEVASPAPT